MQIQLGSSVASAPSVPTVVAGLVVHQGRVTLTRYRWVLPDDGLMLLVGMRSACWLGAADGTPPRLGRLTHTALAALDRRGRLRLDRNTIGYLGVDEPSRFEVVPIVLPTGGVLLAPLADLEARLARVELPA